jgi:hypothetical protein
MVQTAREYVAEFERESAGLDTGRILDLLETYLTRAPLTLPPQEADKAERYFRGKLRAIYDPRSWPG